MVTCEYLPILLFTSGLVTVCPLTVYREYHLINEAKSWADAQSFCRTHYSDLATVSSWDEALLLDGTETGGGGVVASTRWIGLTKTAPELTWHWSVGEVSAFHSWAVYQSGYHCGGMKSDGMWYPKNCGHTLAFICQKVEAPAELYMVTGGKTWRQAQSHCRQNGWDLASSRSPGENQALQSLINQFAFSMVWIGLFKDQWEWSDLSRSVYRSWGSTQPNNDGNCALHSPTGWYDRACSHLHPFYCQGAKRSMKRVVMMEMTSHYYVPGFIDSAVGEAILTQIQAQNTALTFQWIIQPNGKIFRKKEKKLVTPS